MKFGKRSIIILSFISLFIIIIMIRFNEDFYLEYLKHKSSTGEFKFMYNISGDTLSNIYGIYTIKDKTNLFKLINGEITQINSSDWKTIPFFSKSEYEKVEVIKYTQDSDLAIIKFHRLKEPKMDPVGLIYIPSIYIHDTLPKFEK